jgi:hypothetical protein
MPDAITGNTQMVATKQDLIAAVVQKELKHRAILAPFFMDLSSLAVKGAKTVSIPKMTSFTAIDRASGVAGDSTVLTAAVDQMALEWNAYVAWLIDESDAVQSSIDWELMTVTRAASAHSRFFESKLIAAAFASGKLLTAGAISRDKILEGREYLRKNEADLSQVILAVAPDQETALLKIDEFTRADIYGSAVVPNGVAGRLYGMPVVIHSGLADGQYFLAEREGLAYAFQSGPNYSEQGANEFGALSRRRAMDQLFGVKALQIDQGIATGGKSALIACSA